MADLVLSDSLTLSDSIQVGRGNRVSDQITLSDSVIVELGPTLVTQLPVEVLTGSEGNVIVTQVPVEFLVPTNGLIQLIFSDTLTLSDSVKVGRGLVIAETMTMADSASAVPSAPETLTLSDTLSLSDNFASRLLVQIQLTVSDSITTLTDSATPFLSIPMRQMTQEPVEILTGSQGNVRLTQIPIEFLVPTSGLMQLVLSDTMTMTDSFVKSLQQATVVSASDTIVIVDSLKIGYGLLIGDSFTLTDSISTSTSTPITVTVSDDLNNWTDSYSQVVGEFEALTESLSDTMNFWADSFTEELVFHPRDIPSGDPTANCCPPSIFITD